MNAEAIDMGPGLNALDWAIVFADLPAYLRGVPLARSLVERGVSSWDDLASEVYLDLVTKNLSIKGRYDPDRAKLSSYVATVVISRCRMVQRSWSRRGAGKPEVLHQMAVLGSICPMPASGASDLDVDPAQMALLTVAAQQPTVRVPRTRRTKTAEDTTQMALFERPQEQG